MSKRSGVREYAVARFAAHLPKVHEGKWDGTKFRQTIIGEIATKFDMTPQSAATHYGFAMQKARIEDPASVEGIGREAGKRGGRPAEYHVAVVVAKTGRLVKSEISEGQARVMIKTAEAQKKTPLRLATEEELAAFA